MEIIRTLAVACVHVLGNMLGIMAIGVAAFFLIGASLWKSLPADERSAAAQTAIAFLAFAAVLLYFAPDLPAK
jgi:hypothetical protein